jgi:Zn-dependent M28 family amino/carboxypeptidase
VAALLEVARAVAASPVKPRRSLVFALWTGEEEGHFGSEHYLRHPLWPLAHTPVYINLDMIGHPWSPAEIRALVEEKKQKLGDDFWKSLKPEWFAEPGVPDWAPELEAVLARAGRGTGMSLHFDRVDGGSGGSDYAGFARGRIPWVRFFGNYFPGYHEAGDTPDRLDMDQVQRMASLALATAWLLADR